MTNEVTTKPKTELAPWQNALLKAEGKFMAISGKEEETKIELGFAAMAIEANDKLKSCDPASIVNAVINVARVGSTLNPVLKLGYLVPRGNKCVFDASYIGKVKMLKDNNCLKDIQVTIVYSDETFEESGNPIIKPVHIKKYAKTEAEQKAREKIGVYCTVLLPDNTVVYTPFTPGWEILKSRDVSPSAKSEYSPWAKWTEDMWKKTKIHKDFKMLISGNPNDKILAAMQIEEENSDVVFNNNEKPKGALSDETRKNIFGDVEEAQTEDDFMKNTIPMEEIPEHERAAAPENLAKKYKNK